MRLAVQNARAWGQEQLAFDKPARPLWLCAYPPPPTSSSACSQSMLSIDIIARHLKGGSGAPSLESLLPYLRLAGWALKNTTYAGMSLARGLALAGGRAWSQACSLCELRDASLLAPRTVAHCSFSRVHKQGWAPVHSVLHPCRRFGRK